jgi:hypothetical protein
VAKKNHYWLSVKNNHCNTPVNVTLVWTSWRRNFLSPHPEARSSCPACAQFPEKIVSIYSILRLTSLLFIGTLYHPYAHPVVNWIKESPFERAEIHKNVKNEASMEFINLIINHNKAIPSTPVLAIR